MPVQSLITQQRRLVEVGRIRVGDRKPEGGGFGKPRKTFRITSRFKDVLEHVAKVYGGTVQPWESEWEVCIEHSSIKALFSTRDIGGGDTESLSQWREQWTKNLCVKRCDEVTCTTDEKIQVPCSCDPENRTCKLVTRVSVILSEVPALGLWRLDSGSVMFASEVKALSEQIVQLGIPGPVPILLSIGSREVKQGRDKPSKKFAVVDVRLDTQPVSLASLVQNIRAHSLGEVPVLEAPAASALPSLSNEEWACHLIGEERYLDLSVSFDEAGHNFSKFIEAARKKGVSADLFMAKAQEVLGGSTPAA